MNKSYDVIIVGGGMVGLAMAAALAKNNLSIALLEKNDFEGLNGSKRLSTDKIKDEDFSLRVSAISPGNQQFLSDINCWQNIPKSRLADYEKMFVWDGDGTGLIEFDAAENGHKKLGSIVENEVLRAAIYQTLLSCQNVSFLTNTSIDSIIDKEQTVEITYKQNQNGSKQNIEPFYQTASITAKLLIGADGAFSDVRKELGIQSEQMAYQQTAFVANVKTQKSHQDTAFQRFTPYGPIAFLPLANPHLCSIVWSIDSNKAEELTQLSRQEFCNKLSIAFENKLGKLTSVSQFQGFPLIKRHVQNYIKNRCVLIGDAAHTIHPLAGQGVNLGFQDVVCLSKLVSHLFLKKRDIGLSANLRPFERERKVENRLVQETMSGFKWLFGYQSLPTNLIRNWGMSAVNRSDWLKQLIIEKAQN